MLSQSDAEIVARERGLPGLQILFDPDAFAGILATRLPDAGICAAKATYLRYKPQTSCIALYELKTAQGTKIVYAIAFRPQASAKFVRAWRETAPCDGLEAAYLVLREHGIVVFGFPNDRRLPTLALLNDRRRRRRVLRRALPAHSALWDAPMARLRYRPERRYVARLGAGSEQVLLKLYTSTDFAAVRRNIKRLCGPETVCSSPLLGHSHRYSVQAMAWLPGQTLESRMAQSEPMPQLADRVGAALAQLHAYRLPGDRMISAEDDGRMLEPACGAILAIAPQLTDRVELLKRHIRRRLAAYRGHATLIHGDFSADQVLVRDDAAHGGVALLDLDRVALGAPAADLGTFSAHLLEQVVAGRLSARKAMLWSELLIDGYNRATRQSLKPHHVQLHAASRLLCRVVEPFRYRWPAWMEASEWLLARAEDMVTDVG